jgi:cation:H+ antiporter
MEILLEIALFLIALGLMFGASVALTTSLERVGARLRFPEALLGLLAALGADAPEICSAMASLYFGHQEVSLGVVLGSNVFNLAGLLGLSATVAGRLEIGRQGLLLNGVVGLVVTIMAAMLVFGWVSSGVTWAVLASLFLPYLVLSSLRSAQIRRLPVPGRLRRFLEEAIEQTHRDARKRDRGEWVAWKDPLILFACVLSIVFASTAMVHIAVSLAARWSVPHAVVGYLILAVLTSIPNVVAAVKLAIEGHGVAVVSESLNSNTFNILGGIWLAAAVFGLATPSSKVAFTTIWLLGMTVVAIGTASFRKGMSRGGGAVLIALYLAYVAVILWT